MPVDRPFTYSPGTPTFIEGYWTQTSDTYADNPDSTTDNPDSTTDNTLANVTGENLDAQDPATHVTAGQIYEGDIVSSSYRNITL